MPPDFIFLGQGLLVVWIGGWRRRYSPERRNIRRRPRSRIFTGCYSSKGGIFKAQLFSMCTCLLHPITSSITRRTSA